MTDHLELGTGRPPQYLIYENGAAFGRNGVTWFKWYEPEEAPAKKPLGAVSRFQVPNAVSMPKNRAVGIAICDRLAAMIPDLTDSQARNLLRAVTDLTDFDDDSDRSSLLRTGWRYGRIRRVELSVRKALLLSREKAVPS